MSEFDDKLSAILGNQEAMGQIMALAQSLSGGKQEPEGREAEYTPVEEETFWQRISGGFVGSLKNMGNFLVELCIFLIVALPDLALPAIIVILIIVLLRRKKRIASAPRKTDDTPTLE